MNTELKLEYIDHNQREQTIRFGFNEDMIIEFDYSFKWNEDKECFVDSSSCWLISNYSLNRKNKKNEIYEYATFQELGLNKPKVDELIEKYIDYSQDIER